MISAVFFIIINAFLLESHSSDDLCSKSFSLKHGPVQRTYWNDIKLADFLYFQKKRDAGLPVISSLRGNENYFLPPPEPADQIPTVETNHVISIGSGADVFRPLRDFPEATHYHLFDLLTGWGANPGVVLSEINARLSGLYQAHVTITDRGFLEALPDGFLEQPQSAQKAKALLATENPILFRPVTFKVTFDTMAYRQQIRYFHLHFGDYANSTHFTHLLQAIPSEESLTGILQAGLDGTPHAQDLYRLLKRANPGSPFVLELIEEPSSFDLDTIQKSFEGFLKTPVQVELTPPFEAPSPNPTDPRVARVLLLRLKKTDLDESKIK